jgi:methyl-accepting chemotaxis protein
MNQIAGTIAAAVEQQGAATQEIARNVQQASQGTSDVTSNIAGLSDAAVNTGEAAGQVLTAASELSRQSETLSGQVERFLAAIKAA